jgi:hypothetical protein
MNEMVSMSEVQRIEQFLAMAERSHKNRRGSLQLVAKLRGWHAAGQHSPEIRRKLESLIGRFGNAEF